MKPLPPNSYFVRPFRAFKGFSYTYKFLNGSYDELGASSSLMTVEEAIAPPAGWVWTDSGEPINPETGRYQRVVYTSIKNLFYPSASIRVPEFDRGWNVSQSGDAYVVSISQLTYGERVRPSSFVISTGASSNTITDDNTGKLYSNNTVIGNIFYEVGIAVINKTGSAASTTINKDGMYLTSGSTITVSYESQLTIYENTVICTLEQNELNYSTNSTLSLFSSSSVAGISGSKLMAGFASGTLTPYITTLGLYNSDGDLVAIAKVPRAIRRTPDMDQTFIIKWDS